MIKPYPYEVKKVSHVVKKREVLGFDTETYNGKVTLISDSKGRYKIIKDLDDLFNFLLYDDYRKTLNFFFNLEYDTNAIIKFLEEKYIKQLIFYNECVIKTSRGLIKIEIIPKKCLKIKRIKLMNESGKFKWRGKSVIKFFDISTFYKLGTLENTYDKVITQNGGKPFKKTISAENGFPLHKITQEVIDYCVNDSIACMELAKNFVDMTYEIVKINNFYSQASIGKALMKKHLNKSYIFIPNELQKFALKSYSGGRFEVIKRGYFDKLYMYDINSAYPYVISDLIEANGNIRVNKEFMEDSTYSYFLCNFNIDECIISPLKYYIKGIHGLVYPYGKFNEIYLSKEEFKLIDSLGIDLNIKKAVHLFNERENKPFEWIKEIYDLRQKYKDNKNKLEYILKIAMNSIYGCMIQTNLKYDRKNPKEIDNFMDNLKEIIFCSECGYEDNLTDDIICPKCGEQLSLMFRVGEYHGGQFFNPVYGSTITANTRVKLFQDSLHKNKLEKNILMYATDSITFDKKIKHLDIDKGLGNYSESNKMEGLILGSGLYGFYDKDFIVKNNKFGSRSFGKIDIVNVAKEHKNDNSFKYNYRKVKKLKESKKDFTEINKFSDMEKELNINFDKRRAWEREAKDFNDLLNNEIGSMALEAI